MFEFKESIFDVFVVLIIIFVNHANVSTLVNAMTTKKTKTKTKNIFLKVNICSELKNRLER
jgi:hypothetical protein